MRLVRAPALPTERKMHRMRFRLLVDPSSQDPQRVALGQGAEQGASLAWEVASVEQEVAPGLSQEVASGQEQEVAAFEEPEPELGLAREAASAGQEAVPALARGLEQVWASAPC